MTTFEKYPYGGWENTYRLSNGLVELVITGDVGPRVIRAGFVGEINLFCEMPEMLGKVGGDEWRIYGGHRLWHAPEVSPRTYTPDNDPVTLTQEDGFIRVNQAVEAPTGISKQIDIALAPDSAHATVTHRLTNHGLWDVQLAPWALSVMAAGGVGLFPLPQRGTHAENLAPTSTLSLWAYTNLSDPRWTLGERYILLRQDPAATVAQKIGATVPDGWGAYVKDGFMFLKTFDFDAVAEYADLNSVIEVFTNSDMLELETLGPVVSLAPGASVEHVENWFFYRDIPTPANDADVEQHIAPLAAAAKG
jgi:hypothetical protein